MRSFLLVASALLLSLGGAAIVACGSDAPGTASAAESTADASTSSSTPAEWVPGNHAGVVFLRYANEKLSVVANFFQIPGGSVCSSTTSGPCVLSDCTASGVDAGAPDGLSDPAGTITFKGGALPAGYGTTYADQGIYVYKETPVTGAPWNLGDPITVTATGEWVPRFTATVPAPALTASVAAPALVADAGSDAGAPSVDRTQPYLVSWTGASGGKIDFVLNSGGTTLHTVSATCTFDAAAGSGTVPAGVMAKMVAGPGDSLLYLASDTTVVSGQYTVAVSVQSGVTNGGSNLTLQ